MNSKMAFIYADKNMVLCYICVLEHQNKLACKIFEILILQHPFSLYSSRICYDEIIFWFFLNQNHLCLFNDRHERVVPTGNTTKFKNDGSIL